MAETGDPERRVDLQESISLAFLMLLEQLQPFERAVFLLREVFGYEFAEIAAMLGKSEAACRRSFSRAKLHLQIAPATLPGLARHSSATAHGVLARGAGRRHGDPDGNARRRCHAVGRWRRQGQGGSHTPSLRTRRRGALYAGNASASGRRMRRAELDEVNGQPALIIYVDGQAGHAGQAFSILTLDADAGQIEAIRIIANPEKLTRVY